MVLGEAVDELGIGRVSQGILAGSGDGTSIEIVVLNLQRASPLLLMDGIGVVLDGRVETGHEELPGLRSGGAERQSSKWSYLGYDPEQEREEPCAESGFLVLIVPTLLVGRAGNIVNKLTARDTRNFFSDVVFLGLPCHPGHLRNHVADAITKRPDGKVVLGDYGGQVKGIGVLESSLKQRLRDFESDVIVIVVRGVMALGHLQDIE